VLPIFAALVAASTAVLIFAGGLVTSTGSGLSVPDWPNTYGWFMWTFPLSKMVGGIFYEHLHRLVASTVGFLIVVLAIWLWRAEPRPWVRRLGYLALAAVITQGILGGITVLWYLPDAISIAHASLAQIVFCLTTTIALVTSRGWQQGYAANRIPDPGSRIPARDVTLERIAVITTIAIYVQIVVGATMRHTGAGLAIPDFPLSFGHLIPTHWDSKIAIHFVHRAGAAAVTLLIAATSGHVLYHHRRRRELVRPALVLLMLVAFQITLGALTVLSQKQFIINSLHVVNGALVLVTSLVLTLRCHYSRFAGSADAGSAAPFAGSASPGTYAPRNPPHVPTVRGASA
jgi:cytochrome c oxidase assembly protein subunit 15